MSVYSFSFSANQAGKIVNVYNQAGGEVASGVLGLANAVEGPAIFSANLPTDYYVARTINLNGSVSAEAPAVLDTSGTVPVPYNSGGTPTADTAFLLAMSTVASDGSAHAVSLAWDTRFPQVDWLTVATGTATIPDGAGKCTVGAIAGGDVDFTHATAVPNDPGTFGGAINVSRNGSNLSGIACQYGGGDILGNGQNVQTLTDAGPVYAGSPIDFAPGDVVAVNANIYAFTDADQTIPVLNGAAAITVAIAITRGGSAPTLP